MSTRRGAHSRPALTRRSAIEGSTRWAVSIGKHAAAFTNELLMDGVSLRVTQFARRSCQWQCWQWQWQPEHRRQRLPMRLCEREGGEEGSQAEHQDNSMADHAAGKLPCCCR